MASPNALVATDKPEIACSLLAHCKDLMLGTPLALASGRPDRALPRMGK